MRWWLYSILLLLITAGLPACRNSASRSATLPVQPVALSKDSLIALNRLMVEQDSKRIENYITENKLPMQHYDAGYYGMIIKQGEGPTASDGTILSLRATVRLLNGQVCYRDTIITFRPGRTVAISGLHQVAKILQKGTQARYIFPPSLAYGIYGDGHKIPQRSILEYELEVLSVQAHRP
jgi:FKBP-type peptidyl-prolyl cis-trans isomerase